MQRQHSELWEQQRTASARHLSVGLSIVLLLATNSRVSPTAAQTRAQAPVAPAPLAFTNVTVVDVNTGQLLEKQTVLVVGNRVQAVGPTGKVKAPGGTRVVNAEGKYLIPGLWDMHAHTEWTGAELAVQDTLFPINSPMYIAYGVTGIREMAQRFGHRANGAEFFRQWQRDVIAGNRVGPRAIGPSTDLDQVEIETPDDARRVLDSIKATGAAFIKYHGSPDDPELYFALLREARRIGLPLVGHTPTSVSNIEIADSGQRSIEHLNSHVQCWGNPHMEPFDSAGGATGDCALVAKAYVRNNTWLDPTLVVDTYIIRWLYEKGAVLDTTTLPTSRHAFISLLHGFGVRTFLAGTDCAMEVLRINWGLTSVCQRGSSLLDELKLLAEAGLTPLEALQAATLNPAKYLNSTDSLGTVEAGKLADLVLLDANPLADIRNIAPEKLHAVVANGRYFDRATLDTLRTEALKASQDFVDRQLAAIKKESEKNAREDPESQDAP